MIVATPPARPAFLDRPEIASSPSPARKIRTLIVDDQLLEREVLRRLLKNEADIEIIGISANGREAVEAIGRLKPDLVFLDVQMPELDGFGVVSQLDPQHRPVVIFATANEEFARKAFDVQALDYLIKPCGRERLKLALERARLQIQRKQSDGLQQKLAELLLNDPRTTPRHADRLAVKSVGRILFLRLADIGWAEAADNYIKLHVGEESHLLRETMEGLERRLPADQFLRIGRSTIVNIQHIRELQPILHGDYAVVLHDGTRLTLTRGYRGKLQQLGL
jgi:two-component system LytT family response regulator